MNKVLQQKQKEKTKCALCLYSGSKSALEVHHIDGNKENNNPENLIVLCSICHKELHAKQRELIQRRILEYAYEKYPDMVDPNLEELINATIEIALNQPKHLICCQLCGYVWNYKGSAPYWCTCPNCLGKVRVTHVAIQSI